MRTVSVVARILWIIPVALVVLTIHQVWVARSVSETLKGGEEVTAEVVFFDVKEMVAQTHGIIELDIPLASGDTLNKTLTVPAAWLYSIGELDSVSVFVLPNSSQEVVMTNLAQIQSRTAWVNAMVALLFALMIGVPVWLWNRYLKREGDPAYRNPDVDSNTSVD